MLDSEQTKKRFRTPPNRWFPQVTLDWWLPPLEAMVKTGVFFHMFFFKQLLGEAAWHGGANVRGSEGFVFGMAGINGKSKVHVQNYAEHPDIHLDFDRSLQCFSIFLNMILAGTSCLQLLHYWTCGSLDHLWRGNVLDHDWDTFAPQDSTCSWTRFFSEWATQSHFGIWLELGDLSTWVKKVESVSVVSTCHFYIFQLPLFYHGLQIAKLRGVQGSISKQLTGNYQIWYVFQICIFFFETTKTT